MALRVAILQKHLKASLPVVLPQAAEMVVLQAVAKEEMVPLRMHLQASLPVALPQAPVMV